MGVDIIRGRQTISTLTNKTGGGVVLGAVVIIADADAEAFVSTAVEGQSAECVGVVLDTISDNDTGRVLTHGYTPQINLDGAAVLRDFVKTDGVALQGTPVAAPETGVFAQVLEAGATPAAIIWPFPMQAGGGGAGRTGDDYYGANLIKNSPGQIVVDGAEPQWWDDVANATITDEDTAGEVPPDIHERCFKVVTIANDVYGYQTFTLADEEVLDAGVAIVSLGCWVYCASGAKASVGIFGTNLTLQESAQAGGGAWEWLEVNNITLNAGDATIQVRLIVDTDTAWFTMPMFAVGPVAQPWIPRDRKFVGRQSAIQFNLIGTGDVAWSDTDCTANTDPLAVMISGRMTIVEPNGLIGSNTLVGHSDTVIGADSAAAQVVVQVLNATMGASIPPLLSDDGQIIRYKVEEADADNDVTTLMVITGYWMWA